MGPELLIDGLHALGIGLDGEHGRIERRLDRPATPLPAKPVTRVVHEDLTHRHGGYREEVPATRPRRTVVVRELQIGLVDQRRGLHPVVGAHPASLAARYTTQVLVDERDELIERASVTPTIRIEQLRHVTGYWTVLRVAATPRES